MKYALSEQVWQQILKLKLHSKEYQHRHFCIGFAEHEFKICQTFEDSLVSWPVLICDKQIDQPEYEFVEIFAGKLYLHFNDEVSAVHREQLTLYLPLATTSLHHRRQPFVVVHMAQSLDGMVCTKSGNSKWIGNQQNLTHAHRVRALVDGVMVGGKTARQEHPSLNVRHVSGPDPARILLCNSCDCLQDLPDVTGMRNFIVCEETKLEALDHEVLKNSNLTPIGYRKSANNIELASLLERMLNEGVQSILLEGGPTTIRTFMQQNTLNWVQLHIAPVIFGSGKTFLPLPQIDTVDQALRLKNVFYTQMGDAIMVTGQL